MTQAPGGIPNVGMGGPTSLPIRSGAEPDSTTTSVPAGRQPSRQLDPAKAVAAGNVSAFESSQTDAVGNGGGFIFGEESTTSNSSSQIEFIDMNGDGLPGHRDELPLELQFRHHLLQPGQQPHDPMRPQPVLRERTVYPAAECVIRLRRSDFRILAMDRISGRSTGTQATGTLGISTAMSVYGAQPGRNHRHGRPCSRPSAWGTARRRRTSSSWTSTETASPTTSRVTPLAGCRCSSTSATR